MRECNPYDSRAVEIHQQPKEVILYPRSPYCHSRVIQPMRVDDMKPHPQEATPVRLRQELERYCAVLINVERGRILGPGHSLGWHEWAGLVARRHSLDMLNRRYFQHRNPEGKDVGSRLATTGVRFSIAGENLAWQWGFETESLSSGNIDVIHRGLMDSSCHRDNILDVTFSSVGIGLVSIKGSIVVTQVFLGFLNGHNARDPPFQAPNPKGTKNQ